VWQWVVGTCVAVGGVGTCVAVDGVGVGFIVHTSSGCTDAFANFSSQITQP